MSNIKLKDHNWATDGIYDTSQGKTQKVLNSEFAAKAPLASPALTGTPTAPTAASGTNTTQIATTAFVQTAVAGGMSLDSPAFTGTPTAPTANTGLNTTQIATTAFVQGELSDRLSTTLPNMDSGDGAIGTSTKYARADHTHPANTSYAAKLHASDTTNFGLGNSSLYGHVKLSASTSSTSGVSGGIAATPSAVKSAYDLANTANTAASNATTALATKQDAVKKFETQAASSWSADSTYSGFGYRCAIALSGVLSTMYAEVIFAPEEAMSGNYAPVCQTYGTTSSNGGVYVYSKVNTSISIPTIVVFP